MNNFENSDFIALNIKYEDFVKFLELQVLKSVVDDKLIREHELFHLLVSKINMEILEKTNSQTTNV